MTWQITSSIPVSIDNVPNIVEPVVGQLFSYTFTASGGSPPYLFAYEGCGELAIEGSTSVLSGTPVVAEICTARISVTDAVGASASYDFPVQVRYPTAGNLTVELHSGSEGPLVRYGYRGLRREDSCLLSVHEASGLVVGTISDGGGSARRELVPDVELLPGVNYFVRATCGTYSTAPPGVGFQRMEPLGTIDLPVAFRKPFWLTADHIRLDYGIYPLLDGSIVSGSCNPGCLVTLPDSLSGHILQLKHRWLDSLEQEKARGRLRRMVIP
jgi:hypothetical protein